jgi:pimeloyl-ACP methyl ester carboxylesterase
MHRRLPFVPLNVPAAFSAAGPGTGSAVPSEASQVRYRAVSVQGVEVFYREAGPKDGPTVLLLHGFPTSSHMYRNLIPLLADKYHTVAPDLPGFGFTKAPPRGQYSYTFGNLAKTIGGFAESIGLKRYAIQIFDYGAPVGLRLAVAHPERVTAIVTQNGNAYVEGLSSAWNPIQKYWEEPTEANRNALRDFLKPETTVFQYTHGVSDLTRVAPDGYTLDSALLARPGQEDIQLDLFLDYASNVKLYPAFQQYFRDRKPPLLAVWGKNDPFFTPSGAEAFRRDIPDAEVQFFDTGHFALESRGAEIGTEIRAFLDRTVRQASALQ